MVTLAIRPPFTSSRNREHSIGACADWRVLNWLNTVIRTSPMTSQMTRFLSILFNDFAPLVPLRGSSVHRTRPHRAGLSRNTARKHISFRRFTPGSEGFYDFYLVKCAAQPRQHFLERGAVKRLQKKHAFGLERPGAKIDRGGRQFECARLIHVTYARQIRRQVRKNYVDLRASQGSMQALGAEISLKERHAGDWDDRQKINRNHAAGGCHLAGGDLRPSAWRGAEVHHELTGPQDLLLGVDLEQLESRARTVALRLRLAHVRIAHVPLQPALAGFHL